MPSTPLHHRPLGLALIAFVSLVNPLVAYEWTGAVSSEFDNPGNWNGDAPTPRAKNPSPGIFHVVNDRAHALSYTDAQGTTVIGSPDDTSNQLFVGSRGRAGRLEVSGGDLTIYSYWSVIIGQFGKGTLGVIHVSGGRLHLLNTGKTKANERFFRVGNTVPGDRGCKGMLFVSGGLVIVDMEGGPENDIARHPGNFGGLNIGRAGGDGEVYLSGGVLRVTSPHGTSFVPDNGTATGILTFGLGDGVFEQTASSQISFGGKGESFITFTPGSRGSLVLAGATRQTFDELILQGRIRVDGAWATPADFAFAQDNGKGVLRLNTL